MQLSCIILDRGRCVMIVSHGSGVRAVGGGFKKGRVLWVFKCHQNFTRGANRWSWHLYVTQASNLMRLMFPPSCSGSFDALRSSAEGLKSGGTDRLAGPVVPAAVPPPLPPPALPLPLPPAAPVSSRSLPSKELALLLTLSAGERPVGGSRHSREPGYCGGAVRMDPPEVEEGVVEEGGGQGVLRSRPGETGSDLMLTLEFVLTVSMVPWGIWVTGLERGLRRTERGRKWKVRRREKKKRGKARKNKQTTN